MAGRGGSSKGAPAIYRRGRFYHADLRPWGGERVVLRDPHHPRWPQEGDRTEHAEVAARWALKYVDRLREDRRKEQLGITPPRHRLLREAVDQYLDQRSLVRANNTWWNDRAALSHVQRELGPAATTRDLTQPAMQRLFNRMAREGYAPSTLRTYRQILYPFLDSVGVSREVLKITVPRPVEEDVKPLSDEEIERVRLAADEIVAEGGYPDTRLAVELALATGMREGELFAARWEDLDRAECTIRVARQMQRGGTVKAPKSQKARTSLVLPSFWPYDRPGARGPILTPIGRDTIRRLGKALLEKAELYRLGRGWHVFRHTYSRLFLESGGWLDELQRSLGHSSIAITEHTYGHLRPDRAAQRAKERIYPTPGVRIVK